MEERLHHLHAQSTIGDLPAHELALELATRGEVLAALLERNPGLPGVVVTDQGAVRGVLSRGQYQRLVSRYLGHEVYHPRPIRHMFEAVATLEEPLVLDSAVPIQEAVGHAVTRPRALLYEPLIVRHGGALRLVDFPDLLLADSRISALRNRQMRQILSTVQEGFLLVGRDEKVAAEYSDWLKTLFGPFEIAGMPFEQLLGLLLGEEKAALGREYLQTLFDPNVMERWVADINPLKKVEAPVDGKIRHLAFRFVRSLRQGQIDRVLVRIEDRSREVALARELEIQEKKARERVDLVFALISAPAESLAAFLASFDAALAQAGRQLAGEDGGEIVKDERLRALARTLHAVKGEAGLLGLGRLAEELHACEDLLAGGKRAAIAGGLAELSRLAAEIRATLEQMARLGKATGRPKRAPAAADKAPAAKAPAAIPATGGRLDALARQIEDLAGRLAKEARFVSRVREEEIPPAIRPLIGRVLVQLARNSLVHGIEDPESRRRAGKPPAGTLQLALRRHQEDQRLELIFQDDGRGLDLEKIGRRAAALGLAASAAELPGLIFRPGFSTAEEKTLDAGRGVGLDLVKAEVEALGGKILVHSRPGAFCAFQILLPAAGSETKAAS
jgi:two-component system chemotaxis sensor kinase CheA